jgi:hypothetical protein
MNIKDVNQVANQILQNMLSQNLKKFKLKDKESIIINNPSNLESLNDDCIDFNIQYEMEDCIKVVMINGILNKDLSDYIPDDYLLNQYNNHLEYNRTDLYLVFHLSLPL